MVAIPLEWGEVCAIAEARVILVLDAWVWHKMVSAVVVKTYGRLNYCSEEVDPNCTGGCHLGPRLTQFCCYPDNKLAVAVINSKTAGMLIYSTWLDAFVFSKLVYSCMW